MSFRVQMLVSALHIDTGRRRQFFTHGADDTNYKHREVYFSHCFVCGLSRLKSESMQNIDFKGTPLAY